MEIGGSFGRSVGIFEGLDYRGASIEEMTIQAGEDPPHCFGLISVEDQGKRRKEGVLVYTIWRMRMTKWTA